MLVAQASSVNRSATRTSIDVERENVDMSVWNLFNEPTVAKIGNTHTSTIEERTPMWTTADATKTEKRPRGPEPMVTPDRPLSSYIGKSLLIKGAVSGSEPIEVDGRIEGPISLPGNHVNIGRDGVVMSDVQAAEVVVQGTFGGKLVVSDRVKVQKGGSLIGEVTAVRVSIENGAHLQGRIDMCRPDSKVPELANVTSNKQQPNG
jgi:cytoskeletal protein CcmA (bactofilin family)